MLSSFHSVHQPRCGVCGKHCKSFESLREHLTGGMLSIKSFAIMLLHCLSDNLLNFLSRVFWFSFPYHLGPLAKANCSTIFSERGCSQCMKLLDSIASLNEHKEMCCLPAPAPLVRRDIMKVFVIVFSSLWSC